MRYAPLLLAAAAFLPFDASAAGKSRRVEFVQEFHPAAKGVVELWIPTPLEGTEYQTLISREISGNATKVQVLSSQGNAAPAIYARWEDVKEPKLKIVNVVEVSDRDGAAPGDSGGERYLKPTKHVQTDGIVKDTAAKITAGKTDGDAKARAIYDWVVENTVRDASVRGCGLGDVKTLLASGNLAGKCADLNSLFVGLARASGVPAREVFGQRVAPSSIAPSLGKEGDNSKAQHCRAEYWSEAKKGWVAVDPADVRKLILEEKLTLQDPKVVATRERLFGSWEGTWVAYNYARDFELQGYDAGPVNFLMYPLLSEAKFRPDGVDPQETGYSFKTTVLR